MSDIMSLKLQILVTTSRSGRDVDHSPSSSVKAKNE
jgi:hypothetical protein